MAEKNRHYSYAVYAKDETARSFESDRFGGPIGRYMRGRQDWQLRKWLAPLRDKRVLDVGAGTGRTAIPLAVGGAEMVACDASQAMLSVADEKARKAGASLELNCCDAMALPYQDRSFDTVICLRVLLHVVDWRKALDEICRCAGRRIVLDFPPLLSLASLQVPLRALASLFKPDTQRFRLFSHRRLKAELRKRGFQIIRKDRLFVLPIALHKLIGSLRFTLGLERGLSWLGLRRLVGAPVTVLAQRLAPPNEEGS